jgi:hypothetical protein
MKTEVIEAYDKDGKLLGSEEWERPETMAELLETFEENVIVKYSVAAHVIKVQSELRAKARGPKVKKPLTPAEIRFEKLSQAEKDELMGIEPNEESEVK